MEPKRVTCPSCGGPSLYAPENRYRPFCSERCKMMDLGAWANEDFKLAPSSPDQDESPKQD